jgi:hypothetical protein
MCVVDCDETTTEKICGGSKSKEKGDIKPHEDEKYTTNFSMTPFSQKEKAVPHPTHSAHSSTHADSTLLLNLSQNLRILKKEVFLYI